MVVVETGDALGDRIGRLMRMFDKRSLDADKTINPINMKNVSPRVRGMKGLTSATIVLA